MTKSAITKGIGPSVLLAIGFALGLSLDQHRSIDTEAMLDASVSIKTVSHVTVDRFGDSVWQSGSGSGVIVSTATCEVWTNHHVVAEAAFIEVFPRGWTSSFGIRAKVVNGTPRSDVAVLRMEQCDGLVEASLGDSSAVRPGAEAFVVGNPLGQNPDSITRGIISHTERYARGPVPYLQTDAAINPGNSGGALFNRDGEVIGLNTAIAASLGGRNIGIGYAIPINVVKSVALQLSKGPPSWGDAGINDLISNLTADEAEIFGVPEGHCAVSLAKAPTEGPAVDKLQARDVIYRLNNTPVSDTDQVRRFISSRDVGESLTFHLVRNGEAVEVEVVLAEGWEAKETVAADYYDGYLGMELEMWAGRGDELGQFKTPVIVNVHSLGPAHRGHIESSQKTFRMSGPMVVPYQIDVKTVTGVVLKGKYHAVRTPQELDDHAQHAFEGNQPLLLEIEVWGRKDPRRPGEPLTHYGTAFYKVTPASTSAVTPTATDERPDSEPFLEQTTQTVAAVRP